MLILFFIFFFLFFIWLAWRKPILALALIVVLLPSYQIRFKIGFLPMTVLEMMILILFLLQIANLLQIYKLRIKKIIEHWRNLLDGWFWLILAWLVVATIAIFVSPSLRQAAGAWKAYFIEPILFLVVLVGLVKTKKGFNLILAGLFFSAFYISLWTIAQKLFGFGGVWSLEQWPSTRVWRATGPFPYPNALGLYLAPITILIFGQLITNYKNCLKFTVYSSVFILSLSAIILARSEGAILGILIGLLFYLFLTLRSTSMLHSMKAKIFWGIILLLTVVCLLFILPKSQTLFQKITFQDFSGRLRLNIWQETLEMLKDRPIFGAGLAGYQTIMESYHQIPWAEIYLYPHNLFLNFWSELGLAGLIIFVLILIKFFYEGFNKIIQIIRTCPNAPNNSDERVRIAEVPPRRDGGALFGCYSLFLVSNLSAMVALIIHGLVDAPYFKNDLAVLFWLIVGLSILVNKNFTETKDSPK